MERPELNVGLSALLTDLATCVNYYRMFTPGVYCCVHVPVQLDDQTRVTPGLIAMVNHGEHKQCSPDSDYDHFQGPPNFVLDVFARESFSEYELRRRKFERAGVLEYVAFRDAQPLEWTWNRSVADQFVEIEADHDDLILSTALPGMWMSRTALANRDWWTIMGQIARGVSRRGHHDYMDAIWNASAKRSPSDTTDA